MGNKKEKYNNRRSKGSFLLLPHELLLSDAYISLTNKSVKCLLDVAAQYKGKNNGDLSCTFSLMKKLGWTSRNNLDNARNELMEKGFIVLTRQGGKNKCSLYAITWMPIDECSGKLDRKSTVAPLGYWKTGVNPECAKRINKLNLVAQIERQVDPNKGVVIVKESALSIC